MSYDSAYDKLKEACKNLKEAKSLIHSVLAYDEEEFDKSYMEEMQTVAFDLAKLINKFS